jgi:hypothetical protein
MSINLSKSSNFINSVCAQFSEYFNLIMTYMQNYLYKTNDFYCLKKKIMRFPMVFIAYHCLSNGVYPLNYQLSIINYKFSTKNNITLHYEMQI